MGGSRGAAFANTFQTLVFMIMGLVAFIFIINALGGIENAGKVPARFDDKGAVVQDFRFDKQSAQLVRNDPPKPIGRVVESDNSNLMNQDLIFGEPVKVEFKKKLPKTGEIVSFAAGLNTIHYIRHLSVHSTKCHSPTSSSIGLQLVVPNLLDLL